MKISIIPESIVCKKLTDEEYFSSQYREYISNSKLSLINPEQGGSSEKYLSGFESTFNDSFEVGSAVHAMTLQPAEYFISSITKPSAKLGLWCEHVIINRKAGLPIHEAVKKASISADYYAKNFNEDRLRTAIKSCLLYYKQRIIADKQDTFGKTPIYLSSANLKKVKLCLENLENRSDITNLLYPIGLFSPVQFYNEYAIFCEVEIVTDEGEIVYEKVKAKFDNFTIDLVEDVVTLNDLKTSGKPAKYFMGNHAHLPNELGEKELVWIDGSFQKYHYHRQFGMYFWLLQAYVRILHPDKKFTYKSNVIVQETIPDYSSKIYVISNTQIVEGLKEFKNLMSKVINIKNNG